MKGYLAWCLLPVCAFAAASDLAPSGAELKAQETITEALLRSHIRFLASDLLEGRGPATRGDLLAQAYVASQLEGLGLEPAAPGGGWSQPFDIVSLEGNPKSITVSAKGKTTELLHQRDIIAVAGAQEAESKWKDAELVFVGYGMVAPEYQWDDFKGVDLKGKVLLVMNNDPSDDPALFAGKMRLWYGRWDYKYLMGEKQGAAGMIIIHTTPSAGYPWQVVQTSWAGEQFELPQHGEPRMQVKAWATEEVSRKLVALGGYELDKLRQAAERRDFRPVPLGVKVSTAFTNKVQRKQTANVLFRLPGSDPKLSREVVLITAHHDHLGIKQDAKPGEDVIYNGAEDNAAGVATLLAMARAFKAMPQPPRRTVLFAAVAAEESGLLGSQYLSEHLPVPTGQVAANLNIDGMNIWGRTRDLTMIGMGKSNLDALVVSLARLQGRSVKPDQMSDRGFFYRSDQFNFAKLGIPAVYLGAGMDFVGRPEGWGRARRDEWEEKDYHQPSDQLRDDWNLAGGVDDARLMFLLGARVAQRMAMPAWNPGDEFEGPRKKSLEALAAPK
jgi:Zn-dependent M28 family amino/carboxypeptidase